MTKPLIQQAKEVQIMAGKFLYETNEAAYTDVETWAERQEALSCRAESLSWQKGVVPDEEAERLLAILMSYLVTVRKTKHIEKTVRQVEEVFEYVEDPILKCHLAVFCYGVCYDEVFRNRAQELLAKLKDEDKCEDVRLVEELLESIEMA